MTPLPPTPEAYAELQQAFEHFNRALFGAELPHCLITLQRERRTFGYFSGVRFVRRSGERTDEIATNPSYFAIRSVRDTLSTLAHEMVHAWQAHFGKPGRRGYHNKEWAAKMEEVGLMPTSTGEPGGKKIGEHMTHYIVAGGRFDHSCAELLTREFTLSWLDRFPPERPKSPSGSVDIDIGDDEDNEGPNGRDEGDDLSALIELPPLEPVNRSNRIKYRCPNCSLQVWAKPNIRVLCGGDDCAKTMLAAVGLTDH
ncbi:MAG: zinc metalloproteinase Mpr protein [uncultured Paraburkholderia sp.]|nr:MAG: zinc metalloproteinase Mpr protein [uncultured Paraburkholderia sp.]CAH2811212.1 MAG: zinc metalloproteinase Mpr protein [uncultured Paraburkholderia sp.]CAH2942405.1 MAG: zinc metalloproteinase Mpr protein [uncultured Paraburkholderia sp.]CAH2946140.1 MAG: zinc metalloproteinase Mpr protein [uncultured Paraburkholderia sp.]